MEISMKKQRVLFICTHNSARSQMAEGFLQSIGGDEFEAFSAGLEPGVINQYAVEVMREKDIDISSKTAKSVFDMVTRGIMFSYVITVCDKETEEKCPVFPGVTQRINWPFDDPSKFSGTHEEVLNKTRKVRDEIEQRVIDFVQSIRNKQKEGA